MLQLMYSLRTRIAYVQGKESDLETKRQHCEPFYPLLFPLKIPSVFVDRVWSSYNSQLHLLINSVPLSDVKVVKAFESALALFAE